MEAVPEPNLYLFLTDQNWDATNVIPLTWMEVGIFQDAGGSDSNFRVVGTDGTHMLVVNIYDLEVEQLE